MEEEEVVEEVIQFLLEMKSLCGDTQLKREVERKRHIS
jgi:hypothetical protein